MPDAGEPTKRTMSRECFLVKIMGVLSVVVVVGGEAVAVGDR